MILRTLTYLRLLSLLAAAALLALLVLLRLPRLGTLKSRQHLSCWFLKQITHALPVRIRVIGPLPKGPALWLANHISWLDIPLLGQLFPLSFLAKDEIRHWPFAGWLAQQAGTLFIRRGNSDSGNLTQQLADYLQQGGSVLIFPEGTTTDGSQVRPFHSRLLSCAIASGAPIQPIAISYWRQGQRDRIAPFIDDDDLLAHLRRLLKYGYVDVEIHLLPLIDSQGRPRSSLAREARTSVLQALQLKDVPLHVAA